MDLVHYTIVRADLPHGSQVAQTVHAAGESVRQTVPAGSIAVALHARDAAHLVDVRDKLALAGIDHVLVTESDGSPQAIGVVPTTDRDRVRKVLSALPLAR